jgi:hypothetical protein
MSKNDRSDGHRWFELCGSQSSLSVFSGCINGVYHDRVKTLNFGRKIFCPVAAWRSPQTEYSLQDRTERRGEKDADENSKDLPNRGIILQKTGMVATPS